MRTLEIRTQATTGRNCMVPRFYLRYRSCLDFCPHVEDLVDRDLLFRKDRDLFNESSEHRPVSENARDEKIGPVTLFGNWGSAVPRCYAKELKKVQLCASPCAVPVSYCGCAQA